MLPDKTGNRNRKAYFWSMKIKQCTISLASSLPPFLPSSLPPFLPSFLPSFLLSLINSFRYLLCSYWVPQASFFALQMQWWKRDKFPINDFYILTCETEEMIVFWIPSTTMPLELISPVIQKLCSTSSKNFYWGIVDLQCCVKFLVHSKVIQLYVFFSYSFPLWFITGYWM